ncbi:MAG TPA: hypothetical protein VMR17_21935 [Xanthobacteraceae bacterium]|jgi:hypothetical protein|nr:hypothetical protein [Xanthobacteraceae bacterium]
MGNRAVLIAVSLLAACASGFAQTAPPQEPAAPVPYVLTMGDMMNTLIQPRHAKLGLAGHAENWPLAGYALVEIRQAFAGIVKAQPKFRGFPVGELVDAAMGQPLTAVEAAIRQKDPQKFAAAYDALTQGCNACHMELDHPYVVIKTPDASAFPNQDFGAQR